MLAKWALGILKHQIVETDIVSPSTMNLFAINVGCHFPKKVGTTIIRPTSHFAIFPSQATEAQLSSDGYDTDWSPPDPFVYRMWAGGKMRFDNQNPIKINDILTLKTTCVETKERNGSRGPSLFVTTKKEICIHGSQAPSIVESRTLVYLSRKPTSNQRKNEEVLQTVAFDFRYAVRPTTISLFRFSALTYNSHKIHYDSEYAKSEGYNGLLVHGPLTCSLLLEALLIQDEMEGRLIQSFNYTAVAPMLVNEDMFLHGVYARSNDGQIIGCEVWATSSSEDVCFKGSAVFE